MLSCFVNAFTDMLAYSEWIEILLITMQIIAKVRTFDKYKFII